MQELRAAKISVATSPKVEKPLTVELVSEPVIIFDVLVFLF